MEAILTNIAILLNIASTTDDGRNAIAELSKALSTFNSASLATEAAIEPTGPAVQPAQPEPSKDEKKDKGKKNGSTVKNIMTEKLLASRFRYLNEMLYTQPSSESFDYFKK